MKNPWLDISPDDYEGHMDCPEVNQLSFLGNVFKESLKNHDCSNVAILGCATGNGLEYINNIDTSKLTVIDINPRYLEVLKHRYLNRINGLQIIEGDLTTCHLPENEFTLIFAALLFEYLEPRNLLIRIYKWLCVHAKLIVVLQLRSEKVPEISESPYTSMSMLEPIFKHVDPEQFKNHAFDAGLKETVRQEITIETGKSFYIGTYQKIN